jgi:hypothetical protein
MALWLMKTDDDEYVEWSTVIDAPASDFMTRDEAVDEHGEDRVGWADAHLWSCRSRLGESFEIRNGRAVAVGGGRLAYHFDSYEQVRKFMLNGGYNGARATTWPQLKASASYDDP